MENSTEINSRIYIRIAEICENYLTRSASLYETITKLEGLISFLVISVDLKNEFLKRWGFLEEVFAAELDDPSRDVIRTEKQRLFDAVIQIQKAANDRVENA